MFTSLAQAAADPCGEATEAPGGLDRGLTTAGDLGVLPRRCKRCDVSLSTAYSGPASPLCRACVAECVASVLSDWERSERASRRFITHLRRRKPLWANFLRRKHPRATGKRTRRPS